MNHYFLMILINILTGFLSGMNVYVDKISDIRFSLNDIYMVSLMTSYMIFFMALYYKDYRVILMSGVMIFVSLFFIRTQMFVDEKQYLMGMIPHHSMAIHMSKKLKSKDVKQKSVNDLLENIIKTQEEEIGFMKEKSRS